MSAALVALRVLQADVDDLRPGLDLRPPHLGGGLETALGDELLEGPRAEDVGALADELRAVVLGQLHRLETGDQAAVMVRQPPRRPARHQLGEGGDVGRGGAAAAAHQVEPAGVEEAAEDAAELLRPLAVAPLLVGQAGVGHAGDAGAGEAGEGAQVVGHQVGPGGAVEAEVEQVGVEQRHRQRFGVLAAEHGAGGLDGRRHRHRQAPAGVLEGGVEAEQAGLDVARVLGGLQQQVVGAAGHQSEGLEAEVVGQLLEGDAAGHRDRLGGRPHRAADEARPLGGGVAGAGGAGDLGGAAVDLDGEGGEAVLGEHQRRAAEGVGLDDVGAGGEVALVHRGDGVGPRAHQVLVAALELAAAEVVGTEVETLHGGAGGAVEHQDALLQGGAQGGLALAAIGRLGDRRRGLRQGVAIGTAGLAVRRHTKKPASPRTMGESRVALGRLVAGSPSRGRRPHPRVRG